jgi:hypothetical protein
MPAYTFTPPFLSLAPGEVVKVWAAETPSPGVGGASASQQLALVRLQTQSGTPFNVSGFFSGAPGTFEIDVQGSNDDVDTHYNTLSGGQINSVDSTNNTFNLQAVQIDTPFVRLLMRTRGNSVSVTAWLGR